MAVLEGGVSGALVGAGAESFVPLHIRNCPLPYGVLGHYRTSIKLTMATSQAANSRLFEIRNNAANLIVPLRIRVTILPTGTITTSYGMEIALVRLVNFTAIDTTNTVTPVASVLRTTGMASYPGGAQVRHVTVAGAAAGMTGGSLVRDGNFMGSCLHWAATAGASTLSTTHELLFESMSGNHPPVLAQNEGFAVENTVVGSATANVIQVMIDVSWAEVTAF